MSITVPLEGFGGGTSLNFKVKAYASEEALLATTPNENTIGIITSTTITSWIFSAKEPAEPEEGMVWILTGTTGDIAFNSLKKNAIQIYVSSVMQYVSGTWTEMEAAIYQNEAWKELAAELIIYNRGDPCTDITGGWTTNSNYGASATLSDDRIILKREYDGDCDAAAYTKNKIDVGDYKTICVEFNVTIPFSDPLPFSFGLTATSGNAEIGESGWVAKTTVTDENLVEAEVDISSINGQYYIALCVNQATAEIYTVSLK